MISETWAEQTLQMSAIGAAANVTATAQRSMAGQRIIIRAVNAERKPRSLEFRLRGAIVNTKSGGRNGSRMVTLSGLNGTAENTLARPLNVAPLTTRPGPAWENGTILRLEMPMLSFVIVEAALEGS